MKGWRIAVCILLLSTVSCSYSMTPIGIVSPKFVDKPIEWQREVSASEWAVFADIAVGQTMNTMREKAQAMGADDILNIRMKNNCYWSVIPYVGFVLRCWADGFGMAVKYREE